MQFRRAVHIPGGQSRFALRNVKKSPNQETGLGNWGHLKVFNDIKLVLNEHEWPPLGSNFHHSELLEVLYSPNQFLGWDFFWRFLQQDGFRNISWVSVELLCKRIFMRIELHGAVDLHSSSPFVGSQFHYLTKLLKKLSRPRLDSVPNLNSRLDFQTYLQCWPLNQE